MAFIFPKLLNLTTLALAVYLYLFTTVDAAPVDNSKPKKKNIILLIGDGFGPSGVTLARHYKQVKNNLSPRDLLFMDSFLIGAQRTMVGQTHPMGPVADLIIGGGRDWFIGLDQGGKRRDNRSLIEEVQKNGTWTYVGDRAGFDSLDKGKNVSLPLLGLFAKDNYPYRIDRKDSEYPNLVEQTQVALNALTEHTKDNDKGFFLMVESSRIDHSGHENCVQAHAQEALEYDQVINLVHNYTKNADIDTVVVATADHETGGLVLNQKTPNDFKVVFNATHSGEYLAKQILTYKEQDKLADFVKETVIEQGLGLTNYTDEEVTRLVNIAQKNSTTTATTLGVAIANLTSSRAKAYWGSLDHTSVDVDLYAFSNADYLQQKVTNVREGLAGFHENTDFSVFIKSIEDIDLDKATELVANVRTKY